MLRRTNERSRKHAQAHASVPIPPEFNPRDISNPRFFESLSMRIVLFDTILEHHVCESLDRALRARGHDVLRTGVVWSGHKLPRTRAERRQVKRSLDEALQWKPDVFFNFRVSAIPQDMMPAVKEARALSLGWLPDDPVLYNLCYGEIVEAYDVTLNCGGADVLDFYDRHHGLKGVNFPFWTDSVAYPRRYDREHAGLEVVFLGNCRGLVRGERYEIIAGLPFNVKIFGRVDADPLGIHGGFLEQGNEDPGSLSAVLATAKIGLNLPQFFATYSGSKYDFPELAEFHHFPLPSRVIQYAATGLPIVSFAGTLDNPDFPELVECESRDRLEARLRELLASPERLDALSLATHRRFRERFSADSRARFLEVLVEDPSRRLGMSAHERARWYWDFSGAVDA
jgi:hypothetical protein